MPFADAYRQSVLDGEELKQTMVDVDLADLEGDYAQCRGGITTAQNLPNNDKLSVKTGGGRRNVYHRQVRMSVDREKSVKCWSVCWIRHCTAILTTRPIICL